VQARRHPKQDTYLGGRSIPTAYVTRSPEPPRRRRLGEQGNTPGDSYSDTFVVLGTFDWIVVAIAVLFAHIAERQRLAASIAAVWFGLLVGGALLWAAAIGPAPCPR